MKIKYETECWREEIVNHLDCEGLSDAEVDARADRLCENVIDLLRRHGHEVERAHGQKVGAFAIVQQATEEERAAFDSALENLRDGGFVGR